jgi:hypothetical protein
VKGDRSIDTVYGIRRDTNGTIMIGVSPLSVDENEGVKDLWELDLADMSSLTSHNIENKYLLNAIDAFSK